VLPFALYMLVLATGSWWRALVGGAFDPRWVYALQIALPLTALVYLAPRFEELGQGSAPSSGRAWVLAGAVGAAVFALWIRLDFGPLVFGEPAGFDPRDGTGRIDPTLALTRLVGAAVVVPVMEELFWRAFILRWLERPAFLSVDPRTVGPVPVLVSSVLFASEHHLWAAGLLAGLAYAWLYRKTGSLWTVVAAHAVTNGLLGLWVLSTGQWRFW